MYVHKVTLNCDLCVIIKDGFRNTCYLNRLHVLDLAPQCISVWVWYSRPIYILSHSDILSQDWKVLQDVIIDFMEDSLYRLTIDVLELPCTISPFYISGSVSFLLVLHLWYCRVQAVHHAVRFLVL